MENVGGMKFEKLDKSEKTQKSRHCPPQLSSSDTETRMRGPIRERGAGIKGRKFYGTQL